MCARAMSCGDARRRQPALSSIRPALRLAQWSYHRQALICSFAAMLVSQLLKRERTLQTAGRNTPDRLTGAFLFSIRRRERALDCICFIACDQRKTMGSAQPAVESWGNEHCGAHSPRDLLRREPVAASRPACSTPFCQLETIFVIGI